MVTTSCFFQTNLVGGFEHFLFFHILGITIPTDELIFFTGVGLNHQPETMKNKKNRLDFLLKMKNFRLVGVFPSLHPCLVQNAVHVLLLDLLEVILFLQSGSSSIREIWATRFLPLFFRAFSKHRFGLFFGGRRGSKIPPARGTPAFFISPVNPSPAPGDCRRFLQ